MSTAVDARKSVNADIEDFVRFALVVYGDQRGFMALFAGKRHGNALSDREEAYYAYPDTVGNAAGWLRSRSDKGKETYICAHLVDKKRRQEQDTLPLASLYADGDAVPIPSGDLRPGLVVESSPGRWQGYWPLREPVEPQRGRLLNHRLTDAVGADAGGWGLTKLLRPPGTANHKREPPFPVRVVECEAQRVFDPAELERLLPPVAEPPSIAPDGPAFNRGDVGGEPPVVLSQTAMGVWRGERPALKDDGSDEIDRSESLWRIACELREANASRSAIAAALAERDTVLGWRCYVDRPAEYGRIADKIVAVKGTERSSGATTNDDRPDRFRLVRATELHNLAPPEYLIHGVLPKNVLAALAGQSGLFKSFTALAMSYATSTGDRWYGNKTHRSAVVYVVGEGIAGVRQRYAALQGCYGIEARDFYLLPCPVQFLDRGEVDDLLGAIARREGAAPLGLVVIDTVARCFVGGDENSARDMGIFVAGIDRVRQETGATVLVVHHHGHNGQMRGSTALRGAVDTLIEVELGDPKTIVLRCTKQKDAEPFAPIALTKRIVDLDDGGTSLDFDAVEAERACEEDGSVYIRFSSADCGPCPSRTQCTKSQAKHPRRSIAVRPQPQDEALQ